MNDTWPVVFPNVQRARERERENVLMKNILIIQLFSKILKGSAELDRGRCQESWAEK